MCVFLQIYKNHKMPGPTPKLTHAQMRLKVCAVCYCRSGYKAVKVVASRHEKLIQDLVFKDYMKDDEKFPAGLCLKCYFCLADHSNKNILVPRVMLLPDPDTYEADLRRFTRANNGPCMCRICEVGRLSGGYRNHFVAK